MPTALSCCDSVAHVLVAYDISNNKTRGRIFALLKEQGLHSQKSVFECRMNRAKLQHVYAFLRGLKLDKADSVVLYPLCRRCSGKGMVLGKGLFLAQTGWMVI